MTAPGHPACPLCAAGGAPAFVKDGYQHFRCGACRSLFVHPVPTAQELAAWYHRSAAERSSALCWEGTALHAVASWRQALGHARRLAQTGPLLDVGCGAGQFLAFARRAGWAETFGVELVPAVAARARATSGATIFEGDLDAVALAAGSCAVATLWDVIEHVPDPRGMLQRVAAVLRPGGVVVVSTPNARGLTTRRFGARALVVMPPEHLFIASGRGLAALAAAAGLEPVRTDSVDLRIRDWLGKPGGEAAPAVSRERYRSAYDRLTGSPVFGVAQRAANAVLSSSGLGDQLVMVARKPAGPRGGTR